MDTLNQLSVDFENEYDSTNAVFAHNHVLEVADQLHPTLPLAPPSFSAAPRPTATWGEIVPERVCLSEGCQSIFQCKACHSHTLRKMLLAPNHVKGGILLKRVVISVKGVLKIKAEGSVGTPANGMEEFYSGGSSSSTSAPKAETPKPAEKPKPPPHWSTRAHSKPNQSIWTLSLSDGSFPPSLH